MNKPWFLYLIECADGSIYTGITVDVAARYAAHCNGSGARYTRSHPPQRLLGYETHPDRSSASKAEYRIKQLEAADKRRYAATLMQDMVGGDQKTTGANRDSAQDCSAGFCAAPPFKPNS